MASSSTGYDAIEVEAPSQPAKGFWSRNKFSIGVVLLGLVSTGLVAGLIALENGAFDRLTGPGKGDDNPGFPHRDGNGGGGGNGIGDGTGGGGTRDGTRRSRPGKDGIDIDFNYTTRRPDQETGNMTTPRPQINFTFPATRPSRDAVMGKAKKLRGRLDEEEKDELRDNIKGKVGKTRPGVVIPVDFVLPDNFSPEDFTASDLLEAINNVKENLPAQLPVEAVSDIVQQLPVEAVSGIVQQLPADAVQQVTDQLKETVENGAPISRDTLSNWFFNRLSERNGRR